MKLLNPLPVLSLQILGLGLEVTYYTSASTKRHIEFVLSLAVWKAEMTWDL